MKKTVLYSFLLVGSLIFAVANYFWMELTKILHFVFNIAHLVLGGKVMHNHGKLENGF